MILLLALNLQIFNALNYQIILRGYRKKKYKNDSGQQPIKTKSQHYFPFLINGDCLFSIIIREKEKFLLHLTSKVRQY